MACGMFLFTLQGDEVLLGTSLEHILGRMAPASEFPCSIAEDGSMKVSIVTISLNQGMFLEECIRSVIEQDYDDIEYIVVDPGSTDGSREIIETYRDRIAHVILEPDQGPADGLNKGFAKATGEIYAYLNADDVLQPGAVRHFAGHFKHWPDVDVVSGHGYRINASGRITGKIYSQRFDPVAYVFRACDLIQQSTFFRASAFHEVEGFNTENRVSWDGELWFEMALAGARFKRCHGFWSCFRMHPDSITVSGRLRHEHQSVQKRLTKKLGLVDKIDNPWLRRYFRLKARATDPLTSLRRLFGV